MFGFSCFWVSGNFQIVIPAQAGIQTIGQRQYSKVIKDPSFPRRRESRPWDSSNIQRLSEDLEILDSRFHGNDEKLRESRPLDSGNIQKPVIPAQAGIQTIGQRQYSKVS
ncbi:hypothetical protein [Neisseria lactamica]|uniref:hypothetical protein n=1 Tax=Neisseria lactamica TaxID=486 RepID=UPI0015F16769|nr:hypothetical protein [Neisseria lactamica]